MLSIQLLCYKKGMTNESGENTDKIELLDSLLEGDHAMVHLDSRVPGVDIPEHLGRIHDLTLKISRLFRGKLDLTEDQIEAELLFDEGYYTCIIPYGAVWGVTDENGESKIWPYSTPKELLQSLLGQQNPAAAVEESAEESQERPQLSVASSQEKSESSSSPTQPKKGRPQLKRIK